MKRSLVTVIFILVTICLLASPGMAKRITIIGEVNDNYQIVADNEIYEVDNNAAGDDPVVKYIAQKVKVVGQLKESGESKIISDDLFWDDVSVDRPRSIPRKYCPPCKGVAKE